jgi:hypothetical protein
MDLHKAISDRLAYALENIDLSATYRELLLSVVADFLRVQFSRGGSCKPLIYLSSLSCEAFGIDPRRSVGVTAAWFLLYVSAYLLDKVEDQELIGNDRNKLGITTNLSTGMIFVAEWILNHLELDCVDPGTAWDLQQAFQEAVLSVCSGQHMDLSESTPDLSVCWNIAETKSGSAFGLACYSGSRLATKQSDVLQSMRSFGRLLGTIVQISDDLEDLQQSARSSQHDKLGAVYGAYARFIESCTFSQGDQIPKYELKQRQDVIRNGTVLYLRFEAVKYAERAKKELIPLGLAEKPQADLLALLGQVSLFGGSPN